MKTYYLIFTLLLLILQTTDAQTVRTQSMAGLSYSILDEDYSLSPFHLGGNPAWLIKSEKTSWLKLIPSGRSLWGDYKRVYDPGEVESYQILFKGIKTLGEDGTFLGETSYLHEQRSSVYRTLKYDAYGGEAFFMNDTTTGNFNFNGPYMKFMYSFELFPKLFLGASAGYKILDGLKSTYSRSQTLYRVVTGDIGMAYTITESFAAGLTFSLNDEQEKIEAKSEDLLDVEIFNFKGETFSVRKRSSTVNQKIKKVGKTIGAQLYFTPSENSEIGLAGEIINYNMKNLIPFHIAATNESMNEYEEGYSSFNDYKIKLQARQFITKDLMISLSTGYNERNSWSKDSPLNLLLWQWDIKNFYAGIGSSWNLTKELLIAVEYEYSNLNADSSKYVDSRMVSLISQNNLVRIGAEFELTTNLFIRAGYNVTFVENDIISGGEDVKFNRITAGVGLKIFESFQLDASLEYLNYSPGNHSSSSRSALLGILTAKLFTF